MFSSVLLARLSRRALLFASFGSSLALLPQASAQTAPQLLPYQARVAAGGGTTTANTKGATCSRGSSVSGYTSYDTYYDGCLATEAVISNAREMITDANGVIYYTDYNTTPTGLVHRIDPSTGITTAIAGGGTTPAAGASCSTSAAGDKRTVAAGDLYGDGCLATSVKLQRPSGLAFSNGDLYVSDPYGYNVRKIALSNGGVSAVAIVNGGSSYATPPTVTFSAPTGSGGTSATGTAVINASGAVTGVTITSSGSGYSSTPTVAFGVPGTGTNAATGIAVESGPISMVVGDGNGLLATNSTAPYADQYSVGCTPGNSASPCYLDAPYGLAVTAGGTLLISEEYYNAVLAINPNPNPETVLGTAVPQGILTKIVGSRDSGAPCVNGSATPAKGSGCLYNTGYANGGTATLSELDNPYYLTFDTFGNLYVSDYYESAVPQITGGSTVPGQSSIPAAGLVYNYAGTYPQSTTYGKSITVRGKAGTFGIAKDYGLGMDPQNNLYITDSYNFVTWRVDGTTQTMYVVSGGAAKATTAGAACGTTGPAANIVSIDTYGDGCPATAVYEGTSYDIKSDPNSNVYMADSGDALYRELATGAQFGLTGAFQTDYIDIHFAAGDGPATTAPYTITAGGTIFSVGTATCTQNVDNNGTTSTQDCVIPVTAAPTIPGAYNGTLTVVSKAGTTTNFLLTGFFASSPITRTGVSVSGAAGCTGSTFGTGQAVTLTATLIANGPTAPSGTIQFYANGTAIGSPTPLKSTTQPYAVSITNTFPTAGTYNITAIYTAAAGGYFAGSTSSPVAIISATPTFSVALVTAPSSPISPGQTGLYAFTISQTAYTGTITYACSGLPTNSSCTFSPISITGAGCSVSNTVAMSVITSAGTVSQGAGFGVGSGPWQIAGVFAGFVFATLLGVFRRRIPLRTGQLLLLFALLLAATGLTACGKAVGAQLTPPTPAFNSTFTVTLTGSDGTVKTLTVPLNVL